MTTKKNSEVSVPENLEIKIRWGDATEISTIYANNLVITHAGSEFFLVFGEIPPILELDKDKIPGELVIKPVVKLAITPENMSKIAEVISTNVANHNKKINLRKDK